MCVGNQHRGIEVHQALVELHGLKPGIERGGILQIAQMLGTEGLPRTGEGEGVLLLGACSQNAALSSDGIGHLMRGIFGGKFQLDGRRRIAARATDELGHIARLAQIKDPEHGIVVAADNLAVVHHKAVRNKAQLLEKLGLGGDDGHVVQIARSHNQHSAEIMQQQMLQGRCGKHDAQLGKLVGQTEGEAHVGALLQQDDRASRASQLLGFRIVHLAKLTSLIKVRKHDGECLAVAMLTGAQACQSLLVRGIAHQVVAAQALKRQNAAIAQKINGRSDNLVGGIATSRPLDVCQSRAFALAAHPPDLRAAIKAGIRLCVETSIGRVVVLTLTREAHTERAHRGVGAIVRKLPQDGEARAAIGAVDEGITIASVVRVEQLGDAGVASRQIGRDEGRLKRGNIVREMNLEAFVALHRYFLKVNLRHLGCRRRLLGKTDDEAIKLVGLALNANENTLYRVKNPALQMVLMSQAVHEGPEAHALNDALNLNMQSFHVWTSYI